MAMVALQVPYSISKSFHSVLVSMYVYLSDIVMSDVEMKRVSSFV